MDNYRGTENFPENVWWFQGKCLPLQPQNKITASVAQLVRAPDC